MRVAKRELEASPEIIEWLEAGLDMALDEYAATVRTSAVKPSGEP